MSLSDRITRLRAALLLTFVLSALGLYQFLQPVYSRGLLAGSLKWQAFAGLGTLAILIGLTLFLLAWTPLQGRLLQGFDSLLKSLLSLKWLNLVLFTLSVAGLGWLVYGRLGMYLTGFYPRLALLWLVTLGGSLFLWGAGFHRNWAELTGAALVLAGVGFKIGAYIPDVSAYPFTLGWSEASRYYYASLYFSDRVYGVDVPPTVLHPSRYLLQSLPFIIPNLPLWFHRFWQVFLWIALTLLSGFLFARRLAVPDRLRRAAVIAWAFLFLILGPVYYHLQVPVILLLWLFDPKRFWRSLFAVLLASAWAGISRVNWFPVPAMLAIALYLLEIPVSSAGDSRRGFRKLARYLAPPFVWSIAGLGAAFGAQALYALASNNPAEQFTSSFTSDLLWYRLFPNPTFPLGILPASLIVSLPLFLLILSRLGGRWAAFHPIRLLGLGAILLVLFAGGLVVSTKIGGGSNLHNMDAYLVLLMVIAGSIQFRQFCPDRPEKFTLPIKRWTDHWIFQPGALALAALVTLYFILGSGSPAPLYSPERAQETLATIQQYAQEASQQGGEVLFITERQLLTFHNIEGVQLIPEYEKVFLMEMAMARNPEYLGKFQEELKNHRFGLIVSEPLFTRKKGTDEIFGEENDAWVEQVSKPVLCYYRPRKSLLSGVSIQLLVPRQGTSDCP